MIGRPQNRFEALTSIFSSVVSPIIKSVSNYAKTAAIYQLDMQGSESWSEVGTALKGKLLGQPSSTPS